jgi:hypothetical protein
MNKLTPLNQRAITAVRRPGQLIVPNRTLGPVVPADSVTGGTTDPKGVRLTGPDATLSAFYSGLSGGKIYRVYVTKVEVVCNDPMALGDTLQEHVDDGTISYFEDGAINHSGLPEFTTVTAIEGLGSLTHQISNPSDFEADDHAIFSGFHVREVLGA